MHVPGQRWCLSCFSWRCNLWVHFVQDCLKEQSKLCICIMGPPGVNRSKYCQQIAAVLISVCVAKNTEAPPKTIPNLIQRYTLDIQSKKVHAHPASSSLKDESSPGLGLQTQARACWQALEAPDCFESSIV